MNKKIFHKQKGILIAFEGISGCGKSEGVESLYRYLLNLGFKTKVLEWNSNKAIRKIVQKIDSWNLLNSWTYSILQWISFLLDYFLKIIPAIKKDYILIADRYIYTGYTRDIVNGGSKRISKKIYKSIKKPDLIFFYDVDPQVCYERIVKRGKILFHPNRRLQSNEILKNENLSYLIKLQHEYLDLFHNLVLAKETNIIHFMRSDDITNMQIRKHVEEYINLKSEKGSFFDETVISKPS